MNVQQWTQTEDLFDVCPHAGGWCRMMGWQQGMDEAAEATCFVDGVI